MSLLLTTKEVKYKEVVDHPNYRVGDDGSVWSKWQPGGYGLGGWRRLRPHRRKDGYLHVGLYRSTGQLRTYCIHQLVLEAFIGLCPSGMVACHHPDPNKANNQLNNLRWDTRENNYRDHIIVAYHQLRKEELFDYCI